MVSIVSVNYKTKIQTERMLCSLFAHRPNCEFEVFVVENGSGDDLSSIAAEFPEVKLIKNEKNLGFAGGCNMGISRAKGDFVVLVNPDIVFDSDVISEVEKKMKEDKYIGVAGISLKNLDGSQQDCVWRFPTPRDQFLLLVKAPHIFSNLKSIRRWLMKDFDYSRSADVDQVMGAFFVIRRQVLDKIGKLDDGFFMWYEEVDFCRRTISAGWRVRYFADLSARHEKGSSFVSLTTLKKQTMVRRSLRRYMKKHFGFKTWLAFWLLNPLFVAAAIGANFVKRK
ncbi:MAG: Glycosyl transferase family 2 [Candidatus Uhrbacteria bacterium GW2011_GWF2_44_350]|nr:MAG: Glycosyl transferase family 2 [Candidatus Uhrbacteria bacterium GW2011_GWF2_44_350]HBR80742.1 hypothetical protein [Candidatus Uhrbacteria bacterium]HCU31895.1 hypothetical protein [Candidatus Uhrbacteria bacterium]